MLYPHDIEVHGLSLYPPCPQVNLNSALSFRQQFNERVPRPFPLTNHKLISAYWEVFDTARLGTVYYRNTTDPTLLRRAQLFLRDIFPSARDFSPSYLVIATWDNVPRTGATVVDPNEVSTSCKEPTL